VAFPQLSVRNHARYSAPVLPRPPGMLPEWQILLKLAAISQGQGADTDPLALDEARVRADVTRLAGDRAEAVMAAVSRWCRFLKPSLRRNALRMINPGPAPDICRTESGFPLRRAGLEPRRA